MSENCPYCGNHLDNFRSTNTLFKEDKDDSESNSWCCFGSKKKETRKEINIDENIIIGKYEKRRSTINHMQRLSNFTGVRKKIHDVKFGNLAPPPKQNLKILLVFNTIDLTFEAFRKAAEKEEFEITFCSTIDTAFDEFQSKDYTLVVIDTRSPKTLDYEVLCRAIRDSKLSYNTLVVGIVKKNLFDRAEGDILELLQTGFNRCIAESTNVNNFINELIQLKMSELKFMASKSTNQALYTALDKCKYLIFITDESYRIQYANVMVEKYLKIRQEDAVGKKLNEDMIYEEASALNAIATDLISGREWEGYLTLKKKYLEKFVTECKAIPVTCIGRYPTHFVLIMQPPSSDMKLLAQPNISERRFSENRKSSMNKLLSYPLEAPITKIIILLDQMKEKVEGNEELFSMLESVEDLLKNSELYTAHLKRENNVLGTAEPVVSELITALLSNQPAKTLAQTSRRSSTDSSVFRLSKVMRQLTTEIDELLDSSLSWDFEIFRLEEITKNRPLQFLGMSLCQHFDVAGALQIDEKILQNWFIIMESHYHNDNFYHNSTHAADVMQGTAGFLERERVKLIMEPLDEAMCLLAAAAHDVDHPGKSSAFLSNSNNPLAILYNDVTILENHHAAMMFKLTIGDERVNIFKNLDTETYKVVRHSIIDMILATEMTKHYEHLAKFVNVFCFQDGEEENTTPVPLTLPENLTLIKRMLIKCADVSNPTRPFRICLEWARRIAEEYFQQTDEEKDKGLPVVMPMFDRKLCSIPKSQIGFVDFIVENMFEAWNAFIDMPELLTFMKQNYIRWKEFDEHGHSTLADIRLLQSSVLLSPVLPSKPRKNL